MEEYTSPAMAGIGAGVFCCIAAGLVADSSPWMAAGFALAALACLGIARFINRL